MFGTTLVLVSLVIFWYVLVLFFIALARSNTGIVHIAWGPGFLLAALVTLWWHHPPGLLPIVATTIVAVWALRLAVHNLMRNWGIGEDARYGDMRRAWGAWFVPRSFVQVFLSKGIMIMVVSLPVLWINTYGGPLNWVVILGAVIWLKGYIWETISDAQLVRFLKHPSNHGTILKTGLWRYSRHPNYFGEILQWWGVWIMALSVTGGWVTVVGPLTITYLLTSVTGIPVLEKRQRRNPAFRAYARRTPALIPSVSLLVS